MNNQLGKLRRNSRALAFAFFAATAALTSSSAFAQTATFAQELTDKAKSAIGDKTDVVMNVGPTMIGLAAIVAVLYFIYALVARRG